jgi:hypothetical protein
VTGDDTPTTGAWPVAAARPSGEQGSVARAGRPRAAGVRLFGVVSLDHHVSGGTAPPNGGRDAGDRGGRPGAAPGGDGRAEGAGPPPAAPPAADGTELIAYRDVAAVVAAAPYAADPLTPQELERYHAVVESAFARRATVPAPPGTVFRSRELVAEWLELHYYTLVEALGFVEDRVEARVSVTRAEPPAHMPLRLAPADTAEMVALGDLTSLAAESFRALRAEAVAMLVLRTGPDALAADIAAHGSFLVERRRWREFEQAVGVEAARHPALRFQCTGPWPPFDFVRMQFAN